MSDYLEDNPDQVKNAAYYRRQMKELERENAELKRKNLKFERDNLKLLLKICKLEKNNYPKNMDAVWNYEHALKHSSQQF